MNYKNINRILVIGCCGAGKTTMTFTIAARTGLPIIHLDKEYYLPDWTAPDESDWVQKVTALAARDCWIMDGNYAGSLDIRLAHTDLVILLDYNRFRCLAGVLKRIITTYHCVRADMAAGCPERFNWEFLCYVWKFHRTMTPRINASLARFNHVPCVRLRNPRAAATFLESFLA